MEKDANVDKFCIFVEKILKEVQNSSSICTVMTGIVENLLLFSFSSDYNFLKKIEIQNLDEISL